MAGRYASSRGLGSDAMHGLLNRSIQCFLRDTYGAPLWAAVARDAGVGPDGFEAMLRYDDSVTYAVLDTAAVHLGRSRESILEDLGTYLVSHPNFEALRRLLRFGGVTFADFLHSLEDLPGRGRLAVPDLDLPVLQLGDVGPDIYALRCQGYAGIGYVFLGVLRGMADDYGALVLLDHAEEADGTEVIIVHLLESTFAAGRRFDLAAQAG